MYDFIPQSLDLTLIQLDHKANRFKNLKHPGELASLISMDAGLLAKFAAKPYYQIFSIPKPGGDRRTIHNPHPDLKFVQQNLNVYFQAAYYGIKPPCAYGFIPRPTDEPNPRNIYTNALVHAGSAWVLNLDLKNYFHTVTSRHLHWVFAELFSLPEPLAQQLIALSTYKGVLPMGAPTSPVLSNLAALPLDAELQGFAARHNALYTRYVDDLTFSLDTRPDINFTEAIRQIVQKQGFALNDSKIRLTPKEENPEVTGLILKSPRPDVSKKFLKLLKNDLYLFQQLTSASMMQRGIFHATFLDKLRKSIQGQLQFLGFIRGKQDKKYLEWGELI
ncbi:MAG: reverse transcriptase family protein [Saprospiraceae bacterium]